ncbi:hypothetical protein [Alysiella crassa]|uniref:hypothetical protein n=1 Tax=Alysiella crassa TaxID=153491 RepID=UPI001FD18818|nr:hypothetical protein [Alysiella crassa]UOP07531.1 hypothetical protein LVJ80_03780 [Alysiella crassa]
MILKNFNILNFKKFIFQKSSKNGVLQRFQPFITLQIFVYHSSVPSPVGEG